MRIVKIILWILLLLIVKTVFVKVIGVAGTMPELLMAFAVIFAFHELRLLTTSYIIIVCGICVGSCMGEIFPAAVLVTGAAGLIARGASYYFRFIPKYVRCLFIIAMTSFVYGFIVYFAHSVIIKPTELIYYILPYVIYTTAAAAVMYPIIIRTLFHEDKNKKLLMI